MLVSAVSLVWFGLRWRRRGPSCPGGARRAHGRERLDVLGLAVQYMEMAGSPGVDARKTVGSDVTLGVPRLGERPLDCQSHFLNPEVWKNNKCQIFYTHPFSYKYMIIKF